MACGWSRDARVEGSQRRSRGVSGIARAGFLMMVAGILMTTGCARVPDEAAGPLVRRTLTVDFTVAGRINPLYYYYIALDTGGNPVEGPVPVVAFPWGNGWGTGKITHFVLYHLGTFGVFRFVPGTDLLQADALGTPFDFNRPEDAPGNRIRVTLDVDATLGQDVNVVNLNIIATDRINIEPTSLETKVVDALGFTGNQFLTLPLDIPQTFTNSQLTDPEQAGDVPPALQPGVEEEDLDIIDWSAEVQINQ